MKSKKFGLLVGMVLMVLTAGCVGPAQETSVSPTATSESEEILETAESPTPTVQPTPIPERSLVVCLGREPETLFLYGGASEAMWSVLEAIYDGPFDTVNTQEQPVIMNEVPSIENGGIVFTPAAVLEGDIVVDAEGNLLQLKSGVQVLPSGCKNAACAIAWQSGTELMMDQMSVQFEFRSGLTWSDGAPLTAADSVYSFLVAADPAMPLARTRLERTAAYTAQNELNILWTGIPGYFPRDVTSLLWLPLPQHQLGNYSAAELLKLPQAAQTPLGWGAYVIDEWVAGDHISLSRNPLYFRADEGLPAFDKLVFRFPGSTPYAFLDSIFIGECDVVDRTANLSPIAHDLRIAEIDSKVNLYLEHGPAVTQLMIGQKPASYDDGYQFYQGDRPDFFGDVRMRRALAMCLDRDHIISNIFYDMTAVPESYVTFDHPLFAASDAAILQHDLESAKTLLNEIGWMDDGSGIRSALGVAGIVNGTELRISLAMPEGDLYRWMLDDTLLTSLQECGFAVDWSQEALADLYAPGPGGRVFGRQFDLALITWFTGNDPACSLYLSSQIPGPENYWVGVNAGGYANSAFDAACQSARQSRPDDLESYLNGHTEAQRIFSEEVPAIPLYFSITAAASRVDLCGYELDASTRSDLWNLEVWDLRSDCIPQE